ncbi:TPA: polysaccharide biosynthesis tyrosine autokinase [Streptococcus agalactiae]|nr:polysaccharide biosynthesis tyrosine autokinase [Streptococcus agalactiae]
MTRLEIVDSKLRQAKKTEEYFNAIRTNIQFSGKENKILAITSVREGEGKSTTSTSLALSLAQAGFKTLLIDADTRNSVMSGTFKATGTIKGLTNYLSGNADLGDIICETNVPRLMVVPSGKVPPNPTALLQNAYFNKMIEAIKNIFDYIIIDTPPIGLVVDAAIESGMFDKKDIFVSTDSELYREICLERGISVVMRKPELSTDQATSYDMLKDFLSDYEDNQEFVLLQVTSPLRKSWHIKEAMEYYSSHDVDNVVSFSEVEKHPSLFTTLSDEGYAIDMVGADKGYRRQDLQPLYYPNGAIFISNKETYLREKSFFTSKTYAYQMAKEFSLDVDTRDDFIHVIGHLFFDYAIREKENKVFYKEGYSRLFNREASKIILGDSKTISISLESYHNYSQGGVTLATMLENLPNFLTANVTEAFVSIGVNDLITGYSVEEIFSNFQKLYSLLAENKIKMRLTTIAYTLFRETVNNADIEKINQWLTEFCYQNQIPLLDINRFLSKDGNLNYHLTSDGLHFTQEANDLLQSQYQLFVDEVKTL